MVFSALGVMGLAAVEQTRADVSWNVDGRIATGIGDAVERSSAFTQLEGIVASKVDQALTSLGRHHASSHPMEQGQTQSRLELEQLVAQSRLGEMELSRGLREGPVIRDRKHTLK